MEYYDQVFDQTHELPSDWAHQNFEKCTFNTLNLSQAAFTKSSFVNCQFDACNLTGVSLKETKLYDVDFTACKVMHVDFGVCNPFGFHVNFQECQLDYSIFIDRKLKKVRFVDCSIREAQFLKCELVGAVFTNCNLELTKFENSDLSQADFSSSFNLTIDPDANKLRKAKFSLYNLPGLLTKYQLTIKE